MAKATTHKDSWNAVLAPKVKPALKLKAIQAYGLVLHLKFLEEIAG